MFLSFNSTCPWNILESLKWVRLKQSCSLEFQTSTLQTKDRQYLQLGVVIHISYMLWCSKVWQVCSIGWIRNQTQTPHPEKSNIVCIIWVSKWQAARLACNSYMQAARPHTHTHTHTCLWFLRLPWLIPSQLSRFSQQRSQEAFISSCRS